MGQHHVFISGRGSISSSSSSSTSGSTSSGSSRGGGGSSGSRGGGGAHAGLKHESAEEFTELVLLAVQQEAGQPLCQQGPQMGESLACSSIHTIQCQHIRGSKEVTDPNATPHSTVQHVVVVMIVMVVIMIVMVVVIVMIVFVGWDIEEEEG